MVSGSTLVVLGVGWALVLLPRALRDLRTSPSTTVTGFNDAMARLAVCDQRLLVVPTGSGQRLVVHPPRARRQLLVRRRRVVLVRLLAAAVASIATAVVVGGPLAWGGAGLVAIVLVGYCAALRRLAVRRAGSATVVPLHPSVRARSRRVERGGDRTARGVGGRPALAAASVPAGPVTPMGRVTAAGRLLRFDATGDGHRGERRDPAGDDGLLFGGPTTDLDVLRAPVLAADGV